MQKLVVMEKIYQKINFKKLLNPCEYEFIELKYEIPFQNDCIDGILVFGDGTIEFHLKNEQDAYNYSQFDNEIIKKILENIGD